MTKIRKHNGAYKGNYKGTVDIHKHTKVRRPMSIYFVKLAPFRKFTLQSGGSSLSLQLNPEPIQDISIGLENPLWSTRLFNCTCSPPILGKYHYPSCFSHTNGIDWSKDMADTIKDLFDDLKSPSYFVVNKEQAKKIEEYNKAISKPSLLTRVKNRFKR